MIHATRSRAAFVVVAVAITLLFAGIGRSTEPSSGGSSITSHGTSGQSAKGIPISEAVGQMIIAPLTIGYPPSPQLLSGIRKGHIGGVILFGSNLAAPEVRSTVEQLQHDARQGNNPALLIMTDQEGGEVRRLAGPPKMSAEQMDKPAVAGDQGFATGRLLRSAGVNVDLAPVADVSRRAAGFITVEHRSFGSNPNTVARSACAFAGGLERARVAFTLKHFPGLGEAIESTDNGPVTVNESAADLYADDAAYRRCGHGSLALVMLSNASYTSLTGSTPALMSSSTYAALSRNRATGVTISDSLDAGALARQFHPGLRAVRAGLDLLLYTGSESQVEQAYTGLSKYARDGVVSPERVEQAARAVLALKKALGLRI
jgi:beta-N-acetylhexosaminidase